MIQFYAPDILKSQVLPPEESVHCSRVLRKKEGDKIYVTDGRGIRYECSILKSSTKGVELEIEREILIEKSWNFNVTIAVAVTKNSDRMSWLAEKATEIGIDRLIFLDCRNNERRNINLDRLRKNAISAMNQSLKTILPELQGLVLLNDFISQDTAKARFFGYCDSSTNREDFVKSGRILDDVTILIGPEGDFSPEEVETLKRKGYLPVTFGEYRLRTETAALYALEATHIMNILNKTEK